MPTQQSRSDPPKTDSDDRARTSGFVHLRAVAIGAHVLAVVLLSLPSPAQMQNPRRWRSANAQNEMQRWSERMTAWDVHMTPAQLEARLHGLITSYARVHDIFSSPFQRYASIVGTEQTWQMFATPQKVPAELHIDIQIDGRWQPLVRPWDRTLDWRSNERSHHRMRKALGRLARSFHADRYQGLARHFARLAAADFPDAQRVRVSLWRTQSLAPRRKAAGEEPRGHHEHVLEWTAEALQ